MLKSIDDGLSEKIMQINTIYKNPSESITYIKPNKYSSKLDEFYAITLILSYIFDNLIIKDENGEIFKINKNSIEKIKRY